MALNTWADWEQMTNDPAVLDALRAAPAPDTVQACLDDAAWRALFRIYLESIFADENINFLDAVDAFKTNPGPAAAQTIWDSYLGANAPVQINIDSNTRTELLDSFTKGERFGDATLFDEARRAVVESIAFQSYTDFRNLANNAGHQARAAAAAEDEPELAVSDPAPIGMTPDRIDKDVVDRWNETALKNLGQGATTHDYKIDDVVIIDTGQAEVQPYVDWVSHHPEVLTGSITMTQKGGAFGPGSITASNVQDRATFEAAIRRVSKKKVVLA